MKLQPFASKELPDIQKRLFRRVHGVQSTISANSETIIEFEIPYNWCKINEMQIINLPAMMKADVMLLDNTSGSYSGIPKHKLNQFGFNVNISKDRYEDNSRYDADLYLGMFIKVVIKNETELTGTIGINFVLHEVV